MPSPSRPTSTLDWATDASAAVTEPPSGYKALGFIRALFPFAYLNWVLSNIESWLLYFQGNAIPVEDNLSSAVELSATPVDSTFVLDEFGATRGRFDVSAVYAWGGTNRLQEVDTDGSLLLLAADNEIYVLARTSGTLLSTISYGTSPADDIIDLSITPNGSLFYATTQSGRVLSYSKVTYALVSAVSLGGISDGLHANGSSVLVTHKGGGAQTTEVFDLSLASQWTATVSGAALGFNPWTDGKQFYSGGTKAASGSEAGYSVWEYGASGTFVRGYQPPDSSSTPTIKYLYGDRDRLFVAHAPDDNSAKITCLSRPQYKVLGAAIDFSVQWAVPLTGTVKRICADHKYLWVSTANRVYALDKQTGFVLWVTDYPNVVWALHSDGSRLYVGYEWSGTENGESRYINSVPELWYKVDPSATTYHWMNQLAVPAKE